MARAAQITGDRKRYDVLDGLRGVAAIGVLFYHFGIRLDAPIIVRHGYLAVDFFFILSGFVIAHSYAYKFPLLKLSTFIGIRAKRLLPLSILGVLIGSVYLILRWRFHSAPPDNIAHILAASALNVSLVPNLWASSGTYSDIFPGNGVLWSLSLEMAVNIIWAAGLVRAPNMSLIVIAAIGAIILSIFVQLHGNADIGWNWDTYIGGAGRALFGFFTGIMLWRFRSKALRSSTIAWVLAAVLIVIFCIPVTNWRYDVAAILVAFPLIVYFAAASVHQRENVVFRFLGEISYPLYAIHFPLLMMLSGVLKKVQPGAPPGHWIYAMAIPLVIISWLVGKYYDAPVRRWLSRTNGFPHTASAYGE